MTKALRFLRMVRPREVFDLGQEDFTLDLGPLGRLLWLPRRRAAAVRRLPVRYEHRDDLVLADAGLGAAGDLPADPNPEPHDQRQRAEVARR